MECHKNLKKKESIIERVREKDSFYSKENPKWGVVKITFVQN